MGPIDTTVAPRPTLPQAGDENLRLLQQQTLDKVMNEASLTEGLVKRRQEFATTGQGRQIYDALSDPNKVMTGIDPNANLKQGIDLRQGYEQSIAQAAKGVNTMDVLTAISSILKERKNAEQSAAELKLQEQKMKADLAIKGLKIDEKTGDITGMTDEERKKSGISVVDEESLSAADNIISGVMKITDIPLAKRAKVAESMKQKGFDPGRSANELIGKLENYYFGNPGTADDLALAQQNDPLGTYMRQLGLLYDRKISKSEKGQRANLYTDLADGFLASLRQVTGDVGVLTEEDAKRIKSLMPKFGMTDNEAKSKLNDLRSFIGAKYGSSAMKNTSSTIMTSPDGKKYSVPSSEVEEAKKNGWK